MQLSPNFTLAEAECNCGCGTAVDAVGLETLKKTAAFLETVRSALGGVPMHVNSWYRCKSWNARVGGETNSYHMRGLAVDFTVKNKTARQVHAFLSAKKRRHLIDGLGGYAGFVHVDRRGSRADWKG